MIPQLMTEVLYEDSDSVSVGALCRTLAKLLSIGFTCLLTAVAHNSPWYLCLSLIVLDE